jgi:predicted permease
VARGVLIIQSAMPAAVLNYLFAARYNNDPQEVAGVVVISTLMSVVALPLFLLSVL